jgi:hypothetical protein
MIFGVSQLIVYSYYDVFELEQVKPIASGTLTFPCFYGEKFWLHMTEMDDFYDDMSYAVMQCENLQIGTNFVEVSVYEDEKMIDLIGSFEQDEDVSTFGFSSPLWGKGAVYVIELWVEEECIELSLDTT